MAQTDYPRTQDNSVNRHKERAKYDTDTVHAIFNSALVAHVSFVADPETNLPVVLPMIARIGQYPQDSEPHAYVHGYVTARLFKTSSGSNGVLPVCICATKIDGLVLAVAPFDHSYQYRSSVIHGKARLIDPEDPENLWAMRLITDGVCPERWENSRNPPEKAEITATRILKVEIESASAKVADGGVKNSRKDLLNADTMGRVWNGVIPVYEVLGEPVASETNQVQTVPQYIEKYREEFNSRATSGESQKQSGSVMQRIMGLLQ